MSATSGGQLRPVPHGGADAIDLLHGRAKDLRAAEFVRLCRRLAAWVSRQTHDGIDPQLYAEKTNPSRRYSSAYF